MNAIDIFDEKINTAKTIAFIKKKLDLVKSNFSIKYRNQPKSANTNTSGLNVNLKIIAAGKNIDITSIRKDENLLNFFNTKSL
tara:strand:- start:79 stop:327 length:249 start_codon:yes stop_codon:yes gene_type:complete